MPKLIWPIVGCLLGSFVFGPPIKHERNSELVSTTQLPDYFPPELNGSGAFFSNYLNRIGEPSLVAAVKEPGTICYRFESLAAQTGRMLAVRFVVNRDGSSEVFAADESGTPREVYRTESKIAVAETNKFLQLVETARFWSMPIFEPENRDAPHKVYKMDAITWILGGVRSGVYHVVLRQGPEPGHFTTMLRFLLKDLARLDERVIPRTLPAS